MPRLPNVKRLTVVTGHYGSGKTTLALNLALDLARDGEAATLVDLDIVNPYFRSSDYTTLLRERGVRVISPTFAGSTLDAPSLPAAIQSAFVGEEKVIFDVGGDDAGATALGRFARDIATFDYALLYVINAYRNLTGTAEEAVALLREIEAACHLKATGIVNNSHLKGETTPDTILASFDFAENVARLVDLPLVATTVPTGLRDAFSWEEGTTTFVPRMYPVVTWVRTPWEDPPGADEEV